MNHFFYTISKALPIIPLRLLMRATRQSAIMPFYHTVADEHLPHLAHLYTVRSVRQFREDLDFFLLHYSPLSLGDILDALEQGKPLPDRSLFLSFDDGLREFKDVVAPILKEKGVPATCFVNTAFVDNKSLFFRFKASILVDFYLNAKKSEATVLEGELSRHGYTGSVHSSLLSIGYEQRILLDSIADAVGVCYSSYLDERKPYLSSDEIRELHADGFEFGTHSVDHPLYCHLSLDDQLEQTAESAEYLSRLLGARCRAFSFPFTDDGVTAQFYDRLFDERGQIVDASFAGAGLKKDSVVRNLQRIPIEQGCFSAKDVVSGEYLYYVLKSVLNKNIICR